MKKLICMILVAFLVLLFHLSFAEGLLPSLSETVGIAMPSLGEALQCYPDSETENEDGSITELYMNVSEADFNTFSVYLEAQGATLADYQVENGLLTAEIQAKGVSFQLSYDSRSGEAKVIYPSGTFDEWTKNAKVHFDVAQDLLKNGKLDEATEEFLKIPQYKTYAPAVALLQNDDVLSSAVQEIEMIPFRTIGSTVVFGHYEQDNIQSNGLEDVEWVVLDVQGDKSLLLSKYVIDFHPFVYNDKHTQLPWEDSEMRRWLNGEFMDNTFSKEERSAILTTIVDNSESQTEGYRFNSGYKPPEENNTEDQIFLLSYYEAAKLYFHSDEVRRCGCTMYAASLRGWETDLLPDGSPKCHWELRSPGYWANTQISVTLDGDYFGRSDNMDYETGMAEQKAVRPAFWLDLEWVKVKKKTFDEHKILLDDVKQNDNLPTQEIEVTGANSIIEKQESGDQVWHDVPEMRWEFRIHNFNPDKFTLGLDVRDKNNTNEIYELVLEFPEIEARMKDLEKKHGPLLLKTDYEIKDVCKKKNSFVFLWQFSFDLEGQEITRDDYPITINISEELD